VVNGVAGVGQTNADRQRIIACENIFSNDRNVAIVLAGCHTLANTDGILVGDPLER